MAGGCGMTLFLPTPLKLLSLSEAALDGWTTAPVMTVREKEEEGKGERGREEKEGRAFSEMQGLSVGKPSMENYLILA